MIGAALGVLLVCACLLFADKPAWFPTPVTAFGPLFDSQFRLTLAFAAAAFLIFHALLIAGIYSRSRALAPRSPWLLEILWTALSAAIFLFLAVDGTRIWAGVHPPPPDPSALPIEVYAHQFAWSFRYPGPDRQFGRTAPRHINDVLQNPFGIDPSDPAGRDDLFSATLNVPANREILLLLHSRDVIHDFFVRELRFKQDVVPGMEIPIRFRAQTPGAYEIACSELCGIGHSQMRATLVVMPPAQFDRWLSQRYSAATTK